jgi:glycosyltransferase involved in cell wall biosynthesis
MGAASITYITTCKGRLEHLRQSLPRVAAQPQVQVIVVDYDCPDGSGQWVKDNFPQVRVVRIDDDPGFLLTRARNAGGQAAATPWLAFFDADILLADDFFRTASENLVSGHYYRADPPSIQTWGSVVCERDIFLKSEGMTRCSGDGAGKTTISTACLSLRGVGVGLWTDVASPRSIMATTRARGFRPMQSWRRTSATRSIDR